ncbi:MAG TPA: putative 2-aminoethylphosphonate ABC transporter ATP-binding protein [Candidatus Nitrosotalea sp.]|jgi:iron(III) transport system ATP-binding protein|nr:putative 2-aminoethylphosphonate ABC transporter ATP-binding protein [Candidatus Nitrosotalea sp.]
MDASRPAAVALEGIAKKFGQFVALNGVSLSVAAGEFVCFLGPSGCGKTTLLRIIAGLERQNAGVVRMSGRDVSTLPPSQRNYGIVFQSYALFPNLTVARNVAYGLETRRVARAEIQRRVDELLALVGLQAHRHKYPAQLSGGEQQRIALARALAPSPALLLLDEPLSALDARVRQSLRHEVRALQRRLGVTTIMVTHDQEEALAMADRIVVMNHGVVEQVGAPVEVYTRPRSPFVARFVGQMNFIEATACERAGWARLGGVEMRHGGTEPISSGTRLTLAIRPEEIVVGNVAAGTENRLVTRIRAIQFLGPFTRLSLALPDGAPALECDVAATAFAALGAVEGSELALALKPEALRVFPAAG